MNVFIIGAVFLVVPEIDARPTDNASHEDNPRVRDDIADSDLITQSGKQESLSVKPWPQNDTDMSFVVPRKMKTYDSITLECTLKSQPTRVNVSLLSRDANGEPERSRPIWQQTLEFDNDKLVHYDIYGTRYEDENPLSAFNVTDNYNVTIMARDNSVMAKVGEVLSDKELQLEDVEEIRFIFVTGDVEKVKLLQFNYY